MKRAPATPSLQGLEKSTETTPHHVKLGRETSLPLCFFKDVREPKTGQTYACSSVPSGVPIFKDALNIPTGSP